MRRDLLPYFSLPFYRAMIERSGLRGRHRRLRRGRRRGDAEAMQAAISERFLEALSAVGSPRTTCARACERYLDAGATSPCVGPIPRTDFEATLRAAAPR